MRELYAKIQYRRAALVLTAVLLSVQATANRSLAESSATQQWPESSSLKTTLDVLASRENARRDRTIFLRLGQHTINFWFDLDYGRIDVRYDAGVWTTVWIGWGKKEHPFKITPPFSTIGHHRLEVRWRPYQAQSIPLPHSYHVWVLPPADRMFEHTDGHTMVLWKGGDKSLDKPLFVVEGIDPKDTRDPATESYPVRYYAGGIDFFRKAQEYGADVVILNFDDGGASIIDNASVVQDAVRYISQIKTGSSAIRLVGISMGGVIARYALANAEADGNTFDVSHFVSLDSPQQGAVLDSNLQDYVKQELGNSDVSLRAEAAKEMLVYNAYNPNGEIHDAFYSKINQTNGNGYPKHTKNIGIALSTDSPNTSTGTWLQIRVREPTTNIILRKINFHKAQDDDISQAGSYLPKTSTIMRGIGKYQGIFDVVWGLKRLLDPMHIPHESVLDIVDDSSKFDITLMPSSTHHHDEIPNDIIYPLLAELDLLLPLTIAIAGPSTLFSGTRGTWNASVGGGSNSYSYEWEYFLT